jgi:S1-C subfamily serine protease
LCAVRAVVGIAYHGPTPFEGRVALEKSPKWAFPAELQPDPDALEFDLDAALASMVTVHAEIPEDAFTAPMLGTERTGSGIAIRADGLVLTIGYLITEAQTIWISTLDGRVVPGHPLAYDFASGFGLVQPLGPLPLPTLPRGTAQSIEAGDTVVVLGRGGRPHALAAEVFDKREFAGYWEYLLDEALFTTPLHPEWSGAALVDTQGRLAGIGSLYVQETLGERAIKGNMFVPIDLFTAIEGDLVTRGRSQQPPRPWLGVYALEREGRVFVQGLVRHGPAFEAGVELDDVIVEAAGVRFDGLAQFLRIVWALGSAGVRVPIVVSRGGASLPLVVTSADREDFLRKPSLQ